MPSQSTRLSYLAATPGTGFSRENIWLNRDYGTEKVWVLNPMHIVSLSSETKSKFVKIIESFKQFSEKWFSHVLLLIFLILYGFIGAYVFVTLEGPNEISIKTSVSNMRENIIRELWWSSQKFTKGWWDKLAKIRMKEFERQLHEACIAEQTTDSEKSDWTFWHALFFSSTIFTTIGYGHVVPKTDAGRVATIIYAFIDLGKLFTRGIKVVFKYCRMIYYAKHLRKVRSVGKKATQRLPTQYMSVALEKMTQLPHSLTNEKDKDSDGGHLKPEDRRQSKSRSRSQSPPKQSRPVSVNESVPSVSTAAVGDETASTLMEDPKEYEVDDEFNLPISVAVILLLLYMMIGAAVFTIWEDWSFFESFYFVYISLSTIGFGDYVPKHPIFMMCTFIYLLFGLALTSMCINVVQEKLSATFQKAKLRIGATMGLDVQQLMAEDLAMESKEESIEKDVKVVDQKEDDNNFKLKNTEIGKTLKERREKKRDRSRSPKPEGKSGNDNEDRLSKGSERRSVGFIDD
ncbi:TWiK family of potassium channels protein 18-like isoform X2 [Oppia nitens]|uniref:TWiK family of potassium channels protein 18-like isoform X2 n=1 Tax=Oppia nitens TaxID=1686743 RepID=UPI0023DA6F3D|nr:TWiK family of potassium channels protein 18-like isoform X2 [Oppia nitens]